MRDLVLFEGHGRSGANWLQQRRPFDDQRRLVARICDGRLVEGWWALRSR